MLDVRNVDVWFSKGTVNEYHALDNLSLSVEAGDFITVIGSNGAGKSTLFNAICGSVPVETGGVFLAGSDITSLAEHRRARMIGRLFQDPMKGTAPDMTIEENLALAYSRTVRGPFSRGVRKQDQAVFREELSRFNMGLENRMKTKTGLLSGGQRQAMTLLMATIARPKLLLLDEHTAALDPLTAETVMNITEKTVRAQKLTTLMITHNVPMALKMGNRTIMMDHGKILLDISGAARAKMTVDDLLNLYSQKSGGATLGDRALFSAAR